MPVCSECLSGINRLAARQCVICGDRLTGAQLIMGDGLCCNCREHPPNFDRASSFGEYKDGLRRLIHLLKYEGITPVEALLGAMLAQAISELLPPRAAKSGDPALAAISGNSQSKPLLVPVPLHKNSRRSRGFNQAELIAGAASKRFKPELEFAPRVLIRRRETISQVGLSREERIENMRGAFAVAEAGRVEGRTIIVVDDVMTTGTTLSECARMLKQAGANRVWAATVARAFHGAEFPGPADGGEQEEVEAAAVSASS